MQWKPSDSPPQEEGLGVEVKSQENLEYFCEFKWIICEEFISSFWNV
jgi:hypothetical protein